MILIILVQSEKVKKELKRLESWYDSHIEELYKRKQDNGVSREHFARMQSYYGEVYLHERLRIGLK